MEYHDRFGNIVVNSKAYPTLEHTLGKLKLFILHMTIYVFNHIYIYVKPFIVLK